MHNQLQLFIVEDTFTLSSTFNFPPIKSDKSSKASIGTYSPNGRKTKYYRLCYRTSHCRAASRRFEWSADHSKADCSQTKVRCIHIPGGNIHSQLAKERAEKLQAMIDRGADLSELLNTISEFRSSKP